MAMIAVRTETTPLTTNQEDDEPRRTRGDEMKNDNATDEENEGDDSDNNDNNCEHGTSCRCSVEMEAGLSLFGFCLFCLLVFCWSVTCHFANASATTAVGCRILTVYRDDC
jgi:hypothetical protein